MSMNPAVTVAHKSDSKRFKDALDKLGKKQVYVGITQATSRSRKTTLTAMAGAATGQKKARILDSAHQDITNAELMFIQSKGSPIRGIPARPVIEPSIVANGAAISRELLLAAHATLHDEPAAATDFLKRAGLAAQVGAQKFFTDANNGLTPNAASTIKAKGSDRPLIDTGALRAAITFVVDEG